MSLKVAVETLEDLLVERATKNVTGDDAAYRELREQVLSNPVLAPLIPGFVRTCRNLSQFWGFIQPKFATYKERRIFLTEEFRPALEAVERGLESPGNAAASEALPKLKAEHVERHWAKANERVPTDPEGALTLARTLLESVCKLILDDLGEVYDAASDLPRLYKHTAKSLKLAPDQHTEQVFKHILGGCVSVIEGLGALRNKLGDAHGQGARPVKPLPRHAQLAVNLAGAMATFLVETHRARRATAAGT